MGRRKADIDIAQAEEMASKGLTDKAIARALGVSAKTIQRRKADSSALSASLARARAKMEAWAADKLVQMMDDPNIPPKVRLTAICWYLERRCGWTLNHMERALEAENANLEIPKINVKIEMPKHLEDAGRHEVLKAPSDAEDGIPVFEPEIVGEDEAPPA